MLFCKCVIFLCTFFLNIREQRGPLDDIVQVSFPMLQRLMVQLLENNSLEAANVMRMSLKIFWSATIYNLPKAQGTIHTDLINSYSSRFYSLNVSHLISNFCHIIYVHIIWNVYFFHVIWQKSFKNLKYFFWCNSRCRCQRLVSNNWTNSAKGLLINSLTVALFIPFMISLLFPLFDALFVFRWNFP